MTINRRQVSHYMVYVGFGSYLALASGACRRRSERDPAAGPREGPGVLTDREYATLAAACERLFPADDDPGAIALGAPGFVERQLASEEFSGWLRPFQAGLAELEADAVARYRNSFTHLAPADQDALVAAWIHGPRAQATFLSRLMHLTLEGVFCDPSHGGNKGGAAWALVGFAPSSPRPGGLHRM